MLLENGIRKWPRYAMDIRNGIRYHTMLEVMVMRHGRLVDPGDRQDMNQGK